MEPIAFLLSNWETYILVAPYLVFGFWAYRWIGRKPFKNVRKLLAAGLLFWFVFLAGLLVVLFAAGIFFMFKYAEHV
jgi:hypothetical protein